MSKSIPVPEALRERLGLADKEVTGQEMVRAILTMEVDLLWNGGIGTYVKASSESHADAGDRANDAVRVDASDLRARVVCEGGNLGFTQEARVEAALRGVHLNTDAIDNSAGVDLSDHEVNYKVALAPLVRSQSLSRADRHTLLFDTAEAACESVLSHNRSQALCLSLDELRARRDPEVFLRAADALCEFAQIDRAELELPDRGTIVERTTHGQGFTRPELAVLLGLAKMHAQALLHEDELVESPYIDPVFRGYFPERFQRDLPDALGDHRLRPEITALRIVNRLLDAGGATLFDSLCTELGVGVPQAASAMLQAEDLLRAPDLRVQLLDRVGASRGGIYQALIELDDGVRVVARYLVKRGAWDLDGERMLRWRSGLDGLSAALEEYLSEGEKASLHMRRERLRGQGLSRELADAIAALPLADRGLNIIGLCEGLDVAPLEAAKTYARLGEETGINWIYGRLPQAGVATVWDRVSLVDIRWELLDLQRHITSRVLQTGTRDLPAAIARFLAEHETEIRRVRDLQRGAAASAPATALSVIAARLRCLRTAE